MLSPLLSFTRFIKAQWHATMTTPSPNNFIFPLQLPSTASPLRLTTPHGETNIRGSRSVTKGYYPAELLLEMLSDRVAVDHFGQIYVRAIHYYKAEEAAQHEFLSIEVQDLFQNNWLVLDRVPNTRRSDRSREPLNADDVTPNELRAVREADESNNLPAEPTSERTIRDVKLALLFTSLTSCLPRSFSLGTHPARDSVYVSTTGRVDSIIRDNSLGTCEAIECIKFPENVFALEKLLVLAAVVSQHRPKYDLFKTQCYWYASTIWDIVCLMFPGVKPTKPSRARGTHSLAPRWLRVHEGYDDMDKPEALHKAYQVAWEKFMETVPGFQIASHPFCSLRMRN
jgi:hypothetical protein